MKKSKKIVMSIICIIIALVLAASAVLFWYFPRYSKNKQKLNITPSGGESINIMSCNIRCANVMDLGKKSWFYRADLIMKNIEKEAPDIIGFQEVTKLQYPYLTECLYGYDSVIEYRDGTPFAEGCPIFYNTSVYKLTDKGSFWLSETPEVMSKSWGSECYRICSYVILEQKQSGKEFAVFNIHLDHKSEEARVKGMGVIMDKIKQFGGLPSVIFGDLNATEDSTTYKNVTESFYDAKYTLKSFEKSCTYQGFGTDLDSDCIDYFLISKTGIKMNAYKVVKDTYDGVYPSDHYQITGEFVLK